MITRVCNVNVPDAIDGDPIRLGKLSLAAPFRSYNAKKRAGRREFFDPPVTGIGDQNISTSINSNSSGRIKLSSANSLSALKRVSRTLRQEVNSGVARECRSHLLKLRNVLVRDVQYIKRSYSSAKGK